MSASDEPDRLDGFPHPREALRLFGHEDAQATILAGIRSGRLHHAWLIGGPEGIGKATFAYQAAKVLLGIKPGMQPAGPVLTPDPAAQASRLVAGLAHPDLIVLRRQFIPDKKRISAGIPVDLVRRGLDMFGSTAGDGGWRVCIIDSAEDLNTSSGNALLKMLEEPPPRSIFLIVAHQPARVLPTIRSRCRKLALSPLGEHDLRRALAGLAPGAGEADVSRAIALGAGSVRRALTRLDPETAALILGLRSLLDRLPELPIKSLIGVSEQISGAAAEAEFAIFMETLEDWASQQIAGRAAEGAHRLAPLAEVWEKITRAARETDVLNLDRKPLVLSIFQDLADAVMRMRMA